MKFGFIAMSGVRAHNKKLTALGLTLPGFIERNKVIASLPSLGLLTLAALTPGDFDIEYVEIPDIQELARLPGSFDVVAISSFSAQIKEAYELADRYRAAGVRVVLGGLHVTARPEEALQHADSVVIGEGEPVWPQLIRDLRNGRLKPIYDSKSTLFDLAEAPLPRFDLLDPKRYNRLTIQTQRGCPYNCEFCAASIRLSPVYRVKPVEKVIAEIRKVKEIWPRPFIEFADDNTFADKRHAKALLHALAKEDIRWFTESDVSFAKDDELLSLMEDSGCAQVLIGFESATPRGLCGVEKKSDWKARQYDSYLEAIEKVQRHGISVNGCFVLGLDGTGPESFQEVMDFVEKSGLHEVQVTVMTPFPGTPLFDRLKQANRLLRDDAWELCTLFDVNFKPDGMTVTELEESFCWLVEELYGERATKERRQRFMRQQRNAKLGKILLA
ncbi:MAG: B12-binding domain-containing radical SAM protein [Hydrogenophilales bacterium 28-61-23]|nr:MAG: B12-binding domain-containing radical SAM protein [Hydrogenophilales bacterium 28-61-23]